MKILLSLLLAFAAAPPGQTRAPGDGRVGPVGEERHCPAATPNAEARVRTLLTSPLLPELRARFDLGTASADSVRLLTSDRDREVCRALWDALRRAETALSPDDRVSFYRAGDRLFVPVTRHRRPSAPGAVQLDGYSSLDVYDSGYRLIGRFGA